ncbi:DUF2332 domain-containing protein [Aquabacterium sp.]|uniref:DUF2332 domain-containing protein n=1 Tax=Aquabacterium sp. TaxID=1872578 RepID=UPI002CFE1FD0|nr:DUF2332 domain-containing protein [Aquabacterium sp.]HSW07090.1 DUF2332 domain-containing protein [Aquabacterium sp.]
MSAAGPVTDATAPGDAAQTLARRQQVFERFASTECGEDPLYVALCHLLAQRPAALALLDAAPRHQQRPNLLLAAIHERVLDGAGDALAAYFPSVGGTRAPDAALPEAFDHFFARQQAALAAHVAQRATQTNEIGRCAVLWPALAELALRCGGRPLALLDFGSSAGLNLGVDAYRYQHGAVALGAPAGAGTPLIHCHPVAGAAPPAVPAPKIAQRLGLDPAPVDVADERALRWLRACLWPHDRARATRFDQAAALVRRAGWRVQQADDCFAAIEPWLDSLPPDVQPVVFNSWVLAYFEPAALARHVEAMRALVQRRGLAWLSAEGPGLVLGDAPPPVRPGDDQVSAAELANASLWYLTLAGDAGQAQTTLLARSHAHGRWVCWEAAAETGPVAAR